MATTLSGAALSLVILTACAAADGDRIDPDPSTAAAAGTGASGSGGSGTGGNGAANTGGTANMGEVSGSRLRARNYIGADGSKQFIGWRDTERNEDCSFYAAADGTHRCFPAAAGSASGYFGDAGCTAPLYLLTACKAPAGATVFASDGDICAATYRIHQLGPKYTAATAYAGTPAACQSVTPPASYTLHGLGAEIPLTNFVEATVELE